MLPAVVFPLHDPEGQWFALLAEQTPALKRLFARAYVSVTPATQVAQPAALAQLGNTAADCRAGAGFFQLLDNAADSQIGDHFVTGYRAAAQACAPEQTLHLCCIDRLMYALHEHPAAFCADIQAATVVATPVLFQRSAAAWATHPRNYFELEQMVTRAGELLWGRTLDWCWCHLAIRARQLRAVLPRVQRHDLSVLTEVLLPIHHSVITRDVDWLAWEDPFACGCDADALRHVREGSPAEVRKRLAYIIPSLQVLMAADG
jgi:hypothetical protein